MVDNRYERGRCMLCHETTEVRHINMYLIGSEGLDCCHPCEMEVLKYMRQLSREATLRRRDEYRKKKKER